VLALLRYDPGQETPAGRNELRAMEKEKASQRNRKQKLECSNPGVARKGQHRPGQRFEVRSHLAQGGAQVVRGLIPQFEELRADKRPILDAPGRGRNRQVAGTQLSGELPHPLHRTQSEPGCRSNDNSEIDDGESCRRQLRTAAEQFGEPSKDWIKRDREYDAPGQDRHEGAEKDKGPVDQQSEQAQPDRELDDVRSGQKLAKRSQGRAFIRRSASCGKA